MFAYCYKQGRNFIVKCGEVPQLIGLIFHTTAAPKNVYPLPVSVKFAKSIKLNNDFPCHNAEAEAPMPPVPKPVAKDSHFDFCFLGMVLIVCHVSLNED